MTAFYKLSFPSIYLMFLFIFNWSNPVYGQPYNFEIKEDTFVYLENSISINNGAIWGGTQSFSVPIDFPFEFMDTVFTNVILESTGRLIFDGNHFYFIDMLSTLGLSDKGSTNSVSPLSYKIDGAPGERILKIEIRNARHLNDPNANINFQIWLYEKEGTIELHVGANNVLSSINFQSGIYQLISFVPTDYSYALVLNGSPNMPVVSTLNGAATGNNFINGIPTEHTVFKFSKEIVSSNENVLKNKALHLYPNPANDYMTIDLEHNHEQVVELKILSTLGEVIQVSEKPSLPFNLNLSQIPAGNYILQIRDSDQHLYHQQFIKLK